MFWFEESKLSVHTGWEWNPVYVILYFSINLRIHNIIVYEGQTMLKVFQDTVSLNLLRQDSNFRVIIS